MAEPAGRELLLQLKARKDVIDIIGYDNSIILIIDFSTNTVIMDSIVTHIERCDYSSNHTLIFFTINKVAYKLCEDKLCEDKLDEDKLDEDNLSEDEKDFMSKSDKEEIVSNNRYVVYINCLSSFLPEQLDRYIKAGILGTADLFLIKERMFFDAKKKIGHGYIKHRTSANLFQ